MGIAAKTGDRIIVVDPATGTPFALMSLDQYEKLLNQAKPAHEPTLDPAPFQEYNKISVEQGERGGAGSAPLTTSKGSGMIEPDFTPWKTPVQSAPTAALGAEVEEDRYYMEPTE